MRKNFVFYEARVAFGPTALLSALILPAYAVISVLTWLSYSYMPLSAEILNVFTLVLPLVSAMSAAHLMVIERDENFDSLRRSYPEASWRLPLIRAIGALVLAAASVGFSVLFMRIAGVTYPLSEIVTPAIPAALFMVMLSLLISNVTGFFPLAMAAVLVYWFMEMQTRGQVTGVLFLFFPVAPIAAFDVLMNQSLLIAAAIGLFLLNVAWSTWRRGIGG